MPKLDHADWPQRLWLVRHGQSAGNVARDLAEESGQDLIDIATRDADTPLSDLGLQQSQQLGRWFAALPAQQRPSILLTSPFLRAQQTCAAIGEALRLPPAAAALDERLREKEFGILDRYTRHGIASRFPELAEQRASVGKFYFRPPGGESWCDVILRLRSVVEELRRDHAGERVLIVAHQVIVNCMRYLLERLDETAILDIDRGGDVPNCSVTEYAIGDSEGAPRFGLVQANAVPFEVPVTTASDQPGGPR
ncbi:histidine phosphatase family protein [Xanthomonas sp. 1678]|uniref:histidine phosphatase family protein n=1 Tax=Xanthomonas sp. 1678 TaxID=3158788 RepID=UPI002857D4E1|nr:broad specificity phosphatase PhoE [Xanthomonas translucens]